MSFAEIKNTSRAENSQTMETPWQNLIGTTSPASIPASHQQLLDLRRERAATSQVQLLDWDSVKNRIGQEHIL